MKKSKKATEKKGGKRGRIWWLACTSWIEQEEIPCWRAWRIDCTSQVNKPVLNVDTNGWRWWKQWIKDGNRIRRTDVGLGLSLRNKVVCSPSLSTCLSRHLYSYGMYILSFFFLSFLFFIFDKFKTFCPLKRGREDSLRVKRHQIKGWRDWTEKKVKNANSLHK